MLSGVAGGRYEVDLYGISVQIGTHRPIYIDAVGTIAHNEAIIGRDVLNQFVVMLNAPAHVVEVLE